MADKKITALTDLSTGVAGADLLHVVDDPTGTPINKKVSVTNFVNNLPSFIGFSNSTEDISLLLKPLYQLLQLLHSLKQQELTLLHRLLMVQL